MTENEKRAAGIWQEVSIEWIKTGGRSPVSIIAAALDEAEERGYRRGRESRRITGQDVHREWRDGMLAQGRKVSTERIIWETLSNEDKALDERIAARLLGKEK